MEERYYDLVFIVRPATPEEEIKKVLTVIEHTVAEKGGKIEKTEHWGTRKLAYRVAKHREGIYVHQEIRTTHGELIAELERRLRVQDNVIKHQRPAELRGVKAATVAVTVVRAAGMVVRGAKADPVAVVRVVPVAGRGASGSISARRRFASSASRRWTSSTISVRTSCLSSCR